MGLFLSQRDFLLPFATPHYFVQVLMRNTQLLSLDSKWQIWVLLLDVCKGLADELFRESLFGFSGCCFLFRLIEMSFVFHFSWAYLQKSLIFFLAFEQHLGLWRNNGLVYLSLSRSLFTYRGMRLAFLRDVGLICILRHLCRGHKGFITGILMWYIDLYWSFFI